MRRLVVVMIIVVSTSMLMAEPVDSSILAGPFENDVTLTLGDSSYYYEIGFSSSAENPKEHVIGGTYPLKAVNGVGKDDGSLYVYWEITGPDFSIDLDSTDLVADGHPDLEMSVTWPEKIDGNSEVFSASGLYSGKDVRKLEISTGSLTGAQVVAYSGTLTLTIRRT